MWGNRGWAPECACRRIKWCGGTAQSFRSVVGFGVGGGSGLSLLDSADLSTRKLSKPSMVVG